MSSRFKVLCLGTNSALPQHSRNPSAQILYLGQKTFLIDCGEGTQLRLSQNKVKRNKISHIFISHLHGDHVYGLPGLLGSYNHFNRTEDLTIYGPVGIKEMLEVIFRHSQSKFGFTLLINEIEPETPTTIQITDEISVATFPLKHRIPTMGFRFDYRQSKRNIDKAYIDRYKLSINQIKTLVSGQDIHMNDGTILPYTEVTYHKNPLKQYAYCSDTIYNEDIIPFVEGVDLLYHETTYLDGLEKEASARMHATIGQAIKFAEKAKVKKLLTGHYSSRYNDLSGFQVVADNSAFPILIGQDHQMYDI